MHVAVTAAFFLAAVLVTFFRGAGSALAFLYLPALLLLSQATTVELPAIPDPGPPDACIYGILVGGLLGARRPQLRPALVDGVVVLLLLAYIASAVTTAGLRAGLNAFGIMGLWLVVPYFVVRCTFEQKTTQREALFALVAAIAVVGLFALIEFRLWPHTFLQQLNRLGIGGLTAAYAYRRFGFFRAVVSFAHPIDLGISAALVLAVIFMLAKRSGVGTRSRWARLGLGAALVASLTSASFTPLAGLTAGLSLYLLLSTVPSARRYLTPGVATVIALLFSYTAYVASTPIPVRPLEQGSFADSMWTRHAVIKKAWEPAATAGPFGWGMEETEKFDVKGFDNAYLLITTRHGWVSLGLWLALPLALAARVSRALRRARSRNMIRAILAGFCACVATMTAMYTVWLGFVYASLFPIVIALTVNATQAVAPLRRASPAPGFRRHSATPRPRSPRR